MKCEEKELLKVIAMNTEENYCSLENKENRNEKTQSLEEKRIPFFSLALVLSTRAYHVLL